jgi:hypothetical protein
MDMTVGGKVPVLLAFAVIMMIFLAGDVLRYLRLDFSSCHISMQAKRGI